MIETKEKPVIPSYSSPSISSWGDSPGLRWPLLVVITLFCIACLLYFFSFHERAFPIAKLNDFTTKKNAERSASKFLKDRGFDISDYRKTALFRENKEANLYLSRIMSARAMSAYQDQGAPLWTWEVTYIKDNSTNDKLVAYLKPDGGPLGFRHETDREPVNRPSVNKTAAQAMARKAVRDIQGENISSLRLTKTKAEQRDGIQTYEFTWVIPKLQRKEARVEFIAQVVGNRVEEVRRSLVVPQEYVAEVKRVSIYGEAIALAGYLLVAVFLVYAVVIVARAYKQNDLRIRFLVPMIVLVLTTALVNQYNIFDLMLADTPPELSRASYALALMVSFIFGLLIMIVVTTVFASAGDYLWRDKFHKLYPPSVVLGASTWWKHSLARPVTAGYVLGCGWLALSVSFYWVGRAYGGVWTPVESPVVSMLSTPLPFLFFITAGITAAFQEELIFRVFGISAATKLLKNSTLAVIFSSALWALVHSYYTVFPVYTRFVELVPLGVLFGWAMLRFGLLAPLVAHFLVNLLSGLPPVVRSGEPALMSSAVIVLCVALLPAAIVMLGSWKRRIAKQSYAVSASVIQSQDQPIKTRFVKTK